MTQRSAGHENNREAAAPPASYGWQPEHPAHKADPEVDDYLIDNDGNGTGSEPADFNEDVNQGPYQNAEHPATPDEGPFHPAQPAGKKAAMRRKAAEKKAAKCIRIAQAMLGPDATVAQIEDQAVDLMDLTDNAIDTAIDRLSAVLVEATPGGQNDPDGDTLNPGHTLDGHPAIQADPEQVKAEQPKEAADFLAEDEEAEELLAAMLAEEEEAPAEPEAMQQWGEEEEACGDDAEAELPVESDISDMMAPEGDPMGLADEGPAEDDALLAELFGGRLAADEEEAEEEEAEEEEAEEEEAGKKASSHEEADDEEADDEEAEEEEAGKKASTKQRPQARKTSKGAKSLGAVTKAASSEVNDLSQLWESAPDVTDVFGS